MRKRWFVISEFLCVYCGQTVPLPRPRGQQREKGHIKDMWCPCCRKESKFKEYGYKESHRTMAGSLLS